MDATGNVTELLLAWSEGDEAALASLIPRVYAELHALAHHYMRAERPGRTMQTTALLHEAYLRLVDTRRMRWQSRSHFLAVAAQAMRRILIDAARARTSEKRGGDVLCVPLDGDVLAPERSAELLALDDALNELSIIDPRKSQVVELKYFGGLTEREVAAVLRVSPETVQRDWQVAKAWLLRELSVDVEAP